MANPADVDDLKLRWHPNPLDDVDEAAVAQTRLDEAWRALQGEITTIQALINAAEVDTATVIDVLCSAALRVLRNPEGHVSGSLSIDDYSESWEAGEASRTSDLYFTSAELRRLRPAHRGAFTIRTKASPTWH